MDDAGSIKMQTDIAAILSTDDFEVETDDGIVPVNQLNKYRLRMRKYDWQHDSRIESKFKFGCYYAPKSDTNPKHAGLYERSINDIIEMIYLIVVDIDERQRTNEYLKLTDDQLRQAHQQLINRLSRHQLVEMLIKYE